MSAETAYFDWNASAPLLPAARAAVDSALDAQANPSSVHGKGRAARQIIETARREIAALAGAAPEHVIFTSGATEAAAMALVPNFRMGRAPLRLSKLYVCATDHPCTLSGGRFAADDVMRFGVDSNGVADPDELSRHLSGHDNAAGLPLVAIHLANNETGVIQHLEAISKRVRDAGGLLVVDAVQAAGRIPLDLSRGLADFVILSSHKLGGPIGSGALVAATGLVMPVPLITGGGQEKGHRAGTENLAGIAGFGAAAANAVQSLDSIGAVGAIRGRIEELVVEVIPDAQFHGRQVERIANTTCFSVPGMKAETLQIAFDLAGVALSAGSACSSGRTGPSHVMKAMGVDSGSAVRISIGPSTSENEIAVFAEALRQIAGRRGSKAHAA